MQIINNIKEKMNNMKLTEFCRQKLLLLQLLFPLDCTSKYTIYVFTSYLKAGNKISGKIKHMHSLLEEMKHRTCHLKLLLCACLDTVQFLRKEEKNIFIKDHMPFIAYFYIKITHFWMRWSLSWSSFSLEQTVFYGFITIYVLL